MGMMIMIPGETAKDKDARVGVVEGGQVFRWGGVWWGGDGGGGNGGGGGGGGGGG